MSNTAKIDLCNGPLFKQTVLYTVPLLLSGLLQLCFNAADMIVVGRYASAQSLAAVGCTSSFCNLIITIFMGLSVGTNVIVANAIGARDKRNTARAVHTSIAVSIVGGILLLIVGMFITRPVLELMNTPPTVIDKACTYLHIFCLGIPGNLLFNFGSAILRAAGDTKSPLRYLTIAGILNVVLNLVFVIFLKMDVAGVAIATIASQYLSAILILRNLICQRDACRLFPKYLRIDFKILLNLIRIGLPAGIQSSLFCMANMIIISGVSSLGEIQLAGNTAASNLEGIIYISTSAYYQAVTSFVGQNYGAGKYDRIVKSFIYCVLSAVAINFILGAVVMLFANQLVGLYTSPDQMDISEQVIGAGVDRMKMIVFTYALCSVMDTITGALRGIGHSVSPAVITLLGACLLRIEWVMFIFPLQPTLPFLLMCMPISWLVVSIINGTDLYNKLKTVKAELKA